MGVLKRLRRTLDTSYLDARHRREESHGVAREWEQWASQHGFDFHVEDPSLQGRFVQRFDEGVETYRYVLRGKVRGLDMVAFEHDRVWPSSPKSDVTSDQRESYLLVRLPQSPSPVVLGRGAAALFEAFGVHFADDYEPDFIGAEWLSIHRSRSHDPKRLALHADLLAQLVSMAPNEVWAGD